MDTLGGARPLRLLLLLALLPPLRGQGKGRSGSQRPSRRALPHRALPRDAGSWRGTAGFRTVFPALPCREWGPLLPRAPGRSGQALKRRCHVQVSRKAWCAPAPALPPPLPVPPGRFRAGLCRGSCAAGRGSVAASSPAR